MAIILGKDCVATLGSATLGNIKDVTINLEKGESDATVRATGGWRATIGTLKNASVDFQMNYDDSDAQVTTLESAFMNDTPVQMSFAAGTSTFSAWFSITNFTRNEGLEDIVTVDVTAAVAPQDASGNAVTPTFGSGSGGSGSGDSGSGDSGTP